MDQKLCKKCDIQKDLIFFNKDKSKNDGYRNSCKECQKNYSRNYYIDNKKNICESSNKYYKSVCHDIDYQLNRKDYMVSYKFENFNKIKEYNKEYNLKNKEEIKEYNHGLYNGQLNYGWDIDHIIPLSSVKTEEDVIRLNHYTNLQPLCSFVNRVIKRDKIIYG